MTTIKDIASHAKVSVATVSYVLNNTRYVSPEKKERILQAIRELDYVPNAVARGLRVRRSQTLSLVVADITNPFYPDIAKACEEAAQEAGYLVNIINTNEDGQRLADALRLLREGKTDGMIITTALEKDRTVLQELKDYALPVVFAHRELPGLDMDSVVSDNFNGAVAATNHLLGLGHRKVAFMGGVEGSEITRLRREGYVFAMRQAGFAIEPEWLISGEARYEPSYLATRTLMELEASKRPTAIININDVGAIGVIDAAYDLRLRVPDDLAVVGFDDLFIANSRQIQLTTVRIPRYELGKRATLILLEKLKKPDREVDVKPTNRIVLPVELIVRRTCGGRGRELEK